MKEGDYVNYTEFINGLSEKDKANYEQYSLIRSPITYRIIFEALSSFNQNVTYQDVNSFVRYDKALKDILYPYLAVIEEKIKAIIFRNFDINPDSAEEEKEYRIFDKLSSKLKESKSRNEITALYKKFALNFGGIKLLIEKYPKYFEGIHNEDLDLVNILRNKTMHHLPLLFDYNGSIVKETAEQIKALISLLPECYKESFVKDICYITSKTMDNIDSSFYALTLKGRI